MYKGEKFNSISHLVGAALAVAGLVVLVVAASKTGDPRRIVSYAVYGTSLVLLYLASTLYHSLKGRAKNVFQKLDHVAIFLLIAGTYTPLALVSLPGWVGWTLFGVNWGLAALGTVIEFIPWKRARVLSHILYVVMGWLAVVAIKPIVASLEPGAIAWIAAGGVIYTTGVVFYAWHKLPRNHEIWHMFVMAGSLCHFVAVLRYLG